MRKEAADNSAPQTELTLYLKIDFDFDKSFEQYSENHLNFASYFFRIYHNNGSVNVEKQTVIIIL